MRLVGLAVILLIVASGCMSKTASPAPGNGPDQPGMAFPPSCDGNRTAVSHGFDGQLVDALGPVGVGCLSVTHWNGFEPTIGLTSRGTVFLYPAFNLGAASQPDPIEGIGVARSEDGGLSWTRIVPNIGPANWHFFTADPFLFVDPFTDRVFVEDLAIPPFNCSNLSFSDDEGETWQHTLGGCMEFDHVSFGAGAPITSQTLGYPVVIYRCAISYGATYLASLGTACQKSLDGGMTWLPPGEPAFLLGPNGTQCTSGAAHHMTVDQRGWIWLPRGWCSNPYVAISKDEGATWERHQVHGEPMSWHDAGVGVDSNGVAYYLWMGEDGLPYLSISTDDGQTWSTPRLVAAPSVTESSMPNLRAGGPGRIAISYLANIDNALQNETDGVHAVVTVGTFVDSDNPVFQSVFANPLNEPATIGGCRPVCPQQADFLSLTIGPDGTPWSTLVYQGHVATAWMSGVPSLWGLDDPNGPYP